MGLVSVTNIADGSTVDAADVNSNVNAIANELNGNIENVNFKDASISTAKIIDSNVTSIKIADEAVTNDKLDVPLQTRLTNLEAPPFYSGDIGNQSTANTYKTIGSTVESYSGITKTDTTTLTIDTKGLYYIHAQQLVSCGAANGYFSIRINNSNFVYGYLIASRQIDMICSGIRELNVGDTIRVHQDAALAGSWAGGHSHIDVWMLKRT